MKTHYNLQLTGFLNSASESCKLCLVILLVCPTHSSGKTITLKLRFLKCGSVIHFLRCLCESFVTMRWYCTVALVLVYIEFIRAVIPPKVCLSDTMATWTRRQGGRKDGKRKGQRKRGRYCLSKLLLQPEYTITYFYHHVHSQVLFHIACSHCLNKCCGEMRML